MKLLAIETATESCAVALGDDARVSERFEPQARRQTELVLPMVEALLAERGWRLQELDAIAFSRGPGAFTGVRVAVAIAQGLGYAAGVPLVPLSTLAICAASAAAEHGCGRWLVAQDARMGELYLGGYEVGPEGVRTLWPDALVHPDALPPLDGAWRGAGSGEAFLPALRAAAPGLGQWLGPVPPRAAAMLPLARRAVAAGETLAPAQAQPVYLRNQVIQGAVR